MVLLPGTSLQVEEKLEEDENGKGPFRVRAVKKFFSRFCTPVFLEVTCSCPPPWHLSPHARFWLCGGCHLSPLA